MKIQTIFFTHGYDKLFGVDIGKYIYGNYAGDNIYDLVSIRPTATVTLDKSEKKFIKKNNKVTD